MVGEPSVLRVRRCALRLDRNATWAFAQSSASEIERHWQAKAAANPNFFNGQIMLMSEFDIDADTFSARFLQTDFKSFLYWRDSGAPGVGVRDGFGSALIRSRDGGVLLGRQRPGHVNSGLAYLPGGFIDCRDVLGDDRIDIDVSILRELGEETGLCADDLERTPGYVITQLGAQCSIAVELVSSLSCEDLRECMMAHIGADAESELADVVIVREPPDEGDERIAPYARVLLQNIMQ